jgi:hypothetical protein
MNLETEDEKTKVAQWMSQVGIEQQLKAMWDSGFKVGYDQGIYQTMITVIVAMLLLLALWWVFM